MFGHYKYLVDMYLFVMQLNVLLDYEIQMGPTSLTFKKKFDILICQFFMCLQCM